MKIKILVAAVILTALCSSAFAGAGSHSTKGYTKKDGTYVAPHRQTNPDKSKVNNWSAKGNTNPYTGKDGTKDPDKTPPPPKKK